MDIRTASLRDSDSWFCCWVRPVSVGGLPMVAVPGTWDGLTSVLFIDGRSGLGEGSG
jgi:hypothetical protein